MIPFVVSAPLRRLVDTIVAAGGDAVAVGGAVRDHLCGSAPKDIDVEVYRLTLGELEAALTAFDVHAVGRAFGVLKVVVDGETFDVALPRSESSPAIRT
jgi:tRNA nucleotidyltransferase/poly(A) polymerase